MSSLPIGKVVSLLKKEFKKHHMPVVDLIALQEKNPFKILISTLLSARTKDETTAMVIDPLFKKIKKPADFNKYTQNQLAKLIYPVGFYKTKAGYLKQLSSVLNENWNGEIPDEIDELIKIPGVGRKTANLVRALAFNKPAICVDIHVHRINNRLGFVTSKNPLETEKILKEKLDRKYWIDYNKIFVSFGQNVCRPISPHCSVCSIAAYCKKIGVKTSK